MLNAVVDLVFNGFFPPHCRQLNFPDKLNEICTTACSKGVTTRCAECAQVDFIYFVYLCFACAVGRLTMPRG